MELETTLGVYDRYARQYDSVFGPVLQPGVPLAKSLGLHPDPKPDSLLKAFSRDNGLQCA